MLSTIDGLLLASSQAVVWDLTKRKDVQRVLDGSDTNEKPILKTTRFWIFILALVGGGLIYAITVLFHVSIFNLVYLVTIAQVSLFPVVLMALYGKGRSQKLGTWSIVLGLIVGAGLVIYGVPREMTNLLTWTPAISLGVAAIPVIVDILRKKQVA